MEISLLRGKEIMSKPYAFTICSDLKDNMLSWVMMVACFTLIFIFGMVYSSQKDLLLLIVSAAIIALLSYVIGVEK